MGTELNEYETIVAGTFLISLGYGLRIYTIRPQVETMLSGYYILGTIILILGISCFLGFTITDIERRFIK